MPLADAVSAPLEGCADRKVRVDLLERVVDCLGNDGAAIDGATAGHLKRLLVDLASGSDPPDGEPGGQDPAPDMRSAARGLAARGLIRLYVRTRDESLPDKIEDLLADSDDAARGCATVDIPLLFGADPDLADRIDAVYAPKQDPPAPFCMPPSPFWLELARKGGPPVDVKDMLSAWGAAPGEAPCLVHALLFFALARRNARARDLLERILADTDLSEDMRLVVLQALAKSYLFNPHTQDGELEVLSLLLGSKDPAIRESAAFFLTSSIGERAGDPSFVGKIAAHIDKMASEAGRRVYE